jgi:hypothetical protein
MTGTLAPLGYGAFGGTVAGTATDIYGSGSTTIGGSSGFLGAIIDGDLGEITMSRDKIEYTNSGSAGGAAQYQPGDIIEGGEYKLTILYNYQTTTIPFGQPEVFTITLPKRGTTATAATIVFDGFMTEHKTMLPSKKAMVVEVTLKVTGAITRTAAS